MFKQMQFFRKIKFSSILVCIESSQNIVTSGRKWRSRNPEFTYIPMESLFGVMRPPVRYMCLLCSNLKLRYIASFNSWAKISQNLIMIIVDRSVNVRKIDATCRDKFKWEWLEDLDDDGVYYSDYVKKLNAAGKVMWSVCKSTVTYSSSGKK